MGAAPSCCCEEEASKDGPLRMSDVSGLSVVSVMASGPTDAGSPGLKPNGQQEVGLPAAPYKSVTTAPEMAHDGAMSQPKDSPPTPGQFLVDVIVPKGGKLGFGIVYREGEACLEIVKLHENGVIKQWNSDHPDQQVEVGSTIHAINDQAVNPSPQDDMAKKVAEAFRQPRVRLLVQAPQPDVH
mmetsp:Transcript_57785/g.137575  ORF Transcript_57785/g.137575 Transcript_57785/m.137575 type:complete len:184 (-) Transcript_57785:224-775(-)